MLAINFRPSIANTKKYLSNEFTSFKSLTNDTFQNSEATELVIKNKKEILIKEISQTFKDNSKIKDEAENIIRYSKSLNQLELAEFVFNNEFFHTEENIKTAKGFIVAAKSNKKSAFIQKIFTNEHLYKNEHLLSKLESILYTFDKNSHTYEPKFEILDKILSSDILYKNDEFMSNIGSILYNTDGYSSSYKTNNVLDVILKNKYLANDKNFINTLGKLFAMRDIARVTSIEFPQVIENLDNNQYQINIIKSIASILNNPGTDVFTQIMSDEKLYLNENFIKFLPNIINSINSKNYQKADEVIAYIDKYKLKNHEETNKEIIYEYMYNNYNSVKEAEQLVKIKLKAYEKKEQLQSATKQLSNRDIDLFFDENKQNIINTIEILGKKNFIHAFSLKLFGLKKLCSDCASIKKNINTNYYEKLLLKINPQASKKYINLQKQITELKKEYSKIKTLNNESELKNLQIQIDTLTKKAKETLSGKLKYDPDTVINKIYVIANCANEPKYYIKTLHKFIDLTKNPSPKDDFIWQEAVYNAIFDKLGIDFDQDLANRLNLLNNRYLGKILSSKNKLLIDALKDLFLLIKNNPTKSTIEIFNELPNNKVTKELFKKHGIDYDKWINFNKNSFYTIPENNNLMVKKVDMNNINKALFLGNEAGCCTSIGPLGVGQASAPTYIKNKFIGAIEVTDSNIPIGNTMCYFANVDNEVSLILDNVHLKNEYKDNNHIKEAIIQYAQHICNEVNKPNIPIYISGHRNKIDISDLKSDKYIVSIIGNSGNDEIYIDFLTSQAKITPNKKYHVELTRIV